MILLFIIAYLVGAIPTGYLFSRLFFCINIMEHGSGNIGATNVARILGGKYFALIFFLDGIKAYGFLFAAHYFFGSGIHLFLAAGCLLLGNAYSCFLKFNGGKGFSTIFGIACALVPGFVVLISLFVFVIALACIRLVGIAAPIAFLSAIIAYPLIDSSYDPFLLIFLIFSFLFICMRHRTNFVVFIASMKRCAR